MTRIVHLSDLHFGAVTRETVQPLLRVIFDLEPGVIVISGDLTQRARKRQFELARNFVSSLPEATPVIAVPGNHDIPLWDILRRLVAPLRRFDRYVTADPYPAFSNDEVAIVGVNTARSLTIKNGRINREQLARIEQVLQLSPPDALRIVVAHHPFVLPEDEPLTDRVGRAELALPVFLRVGVDLLLTGHRHHTWTNSPYPGLLAVHAGTATSRRVRREDNAFNLIEVQTESISIQRFLWQPEEEIFAAPHFDRIRSFPRSRGRIFTETEGKTSDPTEVPQ
ncbi:MAG: metallophosphoesterase [Acidobacteriota bacterium]|nr:metallophosphoesterase [Acidobacteriota bacterium]